MSDSGKGIGGQITEGLGEAVVKPVGHFVSDIADEVLGSVVSQPPPVTEEDKIKQQQQDQKQADYVRDWLGNLNESQAKVREESKQKETARLQAAEQEEKQEEQKDLMKKQEADQQTQVAQQRAMAELKAGKIGE